MYGTKQKFWPTFSSSGFLNFFIWDKLDHRMKEKPSSWIPHEADWEEY